MKHQYKIRRFCGIFTSISCEIIAISLLFFLFSTSGQCAVDEDECMTRGKEVFSMLPSRVGNYQKMDDFRTYSGGTLFDFMNGNAHFFFDRGFECLNVQEYRNARQVLLLEHYRFNSRNGARSIYADETDGNLNRAEIGEESSFEDCYLAFYYKRDFVKLMCFDARHGGVSADESKDIDHIHCGNSGWPVFLRLYGG